MFPTILILGGVGRDTARTSRSGGSGSGGQRTSRGMNEAMSMNTLQRKHMSGKSELETVITADIDSIIHIVPGSVQHKIKATFGCKHC